MIRYCTSFRLHYQANKISLEVNEAEISSRMNTSTFIGIGTPDTHIHTQLPHASNALNNSVTVASFCNTNIIALNMDRCNEALPASKIWRGLRRGGGGLTWGAGACQRLGKAIGTLLH